MRMNTVPEDGRPRAFHVMAKPTGPICNLDCHYCFYLEKEKLYGDKKQWAMAEEVLERHISSFIASQQAPEITFAWQGGEPTLLGVDFFRRAVALQQECYFPVGDVSALAERLNAQLPRGKVDYSDYLQRYDWQRIAGQTMAVYRKALGISAGENQ